jgi:hypothetical protein
MSEITPNTPNPVREDAYKQQLAAKLGIDPKYIPGSPIWHSEEEIAAIAEMFSNMAGSSGGGVLEISVDNDTGALNKTWQEIHDAVLSGKRCIVMEELLAGNVWPHIVTDVYMTNNPGGDISYNVSSGGFYAYTDSADGYPVRE